MWVILEQLLTNTGGGDDDHVNHTPLEAQTYCERHNSYMSVQNRQILSLRQN